MTHLTGGCSCGAIRFECVKPILMFYCHCRDCQRASGTAFVPVVVVPQAGFRITRGTPTWYAVKNFRGSDNRRGFCPTCGARLFGAGNDRIQGITASAFDDSSWFRPTHHIFVSQAHSWEAMDPSLPTFDTYAPLPPGATAS